MSDQPQETVKVQAGSYDFEKNLSRGHAKASFIVENETPWADIQQLDEAGVFLRWKIEPGEFREITNEQIDQLSRQNRTAYMSFREAAIDEAFREGKNEVFKDLPKVYTRPRGRRDVAKKLHVDPAIPGRRPGWKRPDEIREREEQGWRVVRQSDGYSPGYGTTEGAGDTIVVKTRDGQRDDGILMDIDEQLYQKIIWDNSDYADSIVKRSEEEFEDLADKAGVKTFRHGDPVDRQAVETPRSRARRAAVQQGSSE